MGKHKKKQNKIINSFFVDKENTNQAKNNTHELLLCNLFMVNQNTYQQEYDT